MPQPLAGQLRRIRAGRPTATLLGGCPVPEANPPRAMDGACLAVARPSPTADTTLGAARGSLRPRLPGPGAPTRTGGWSRENGNAGLSHPGLPPPQETCRAVVRATPAPG